jgi:hypothetical protein
MLRTLAAALGALLTVIVVVLFAHVSTVVTHLGAKFALLLGELAVGGHQTDGGLQYFDALHTAVRAIVHAVLTSHFSQTNFTVDQAVLAGFQAGYVGGIYQCIHNKTGL